MIHIFKFQVFSSFKFNFLSSVHVTNPSLFFQGVLARVKELITPVTPGWLKDLVLKPPQTTSVTDALEQTVAEVR